MLATHLVGGLLRISLGWVFLWAFLDKLLGLGFATCRETGGGAVTVLCEKAWLVGGSPTTGYLRAATRGPLASLFQSLAGQGWVDWLFMLGLLGVGIALTFGILLRVAAVSGGVLMALMYLAAWPPPQNPIVDDHVVYALVLIVLDRLRAGEWLGLGQRWAAQPWVHRYPWLR